MPEVIVNNFENYWEPPEWLNEKCLTEILQEHESDNSISIKTMSIVPAVAKGEHYASCMYRIKINYTSSIYVSIILTQKHYFVYNRYVR